MSTAIHRVLSPPRGELDWGAAVPALCPSPGLYPEQHGSVPHGQPDPQAVTDNRASGGKEKKQTKLKTIPSMHKQWPSCTGQVFLCSLYNLTAVVANTIQLFIQWTDTNVELSLQGESVLKANLPSAVLTGAAGEWEQEQQRCLGESVEDLIVFADCVSHEAKCCSQVLSWGGISGGTAELPRCNLLRPLGWAGLGGGCWAAPRRTN